MSGTTKAGRRGTRLTLCGPCGRGVHRGEGGTHRVYGWDRLKWGAFCPCRICEHITAHVDDQRRAARRHDEGLEEGMERCRELE